MITNIMQKPIPACLGHHTSFKNLYSILTSGIGKNQEICFWAFSNMYKNDEEEIELGLKLQAIVDAEMRKISDKSMFQKAGGYKQSASISFMEGESTLYMLRNYGAFRLDFDFRHIEAIGLADFLDCEYVNKNDIEEYGLEYASMICTKFQELYNNRNNPERFSNSNITNLFDYIMMDIDLLRKPLIVKEYKWHNECEWRKIIQIKEGDVDIYSKENRPFKKVYYPIKTLTGVTLLFDTKNYFHSLINVLKLFFFTVSHAFMWKKKIKIVRI